MGTAQDISMIYETRHEMCKTNEAQIMGTAQYENTGMI